MSFLKPDKYTNGKCNRSYQFRIASNQYFLADSHNISFITVNNINFLLRQLKITASITHIHTHTHIHTYTSDNEQHGYAQRDTLLLFLSNFILSAFLSAWHIVLQFTIKDYSLRKFGMLWKRRKKIPSQMLYTYSIYNIYTLRQRLQFAFRFYMKILIKFLNFLHKIVWWSFFTAY